MAKTITFKNKSETITFKNDSKTITFKNNFDSIIFNITQGRGIGWMTIGTTNIVG